MKKSTGSSGSQGEGLGSWESGFSAQSGSGRGRSLIDFPGQPSDEFAFSARRSATWPRELAPEGPQLRLDRDAGSDHLDSLDDDRHARVKPLGDDSQPLVGLGCLDSLDHHLALGIHDVHGGPCFCFQNGGCRDDDGILDLIDNGPELDVLTGQKAPVGVRDPRLGKKGGRCLVDHVVDEVALPLVGMLLIAHHAGSGETDLQAFARQLRRTVEVARAGSDVDAHRVELRIVASCKRHRRQGQRVANFTFASPIRPSIAYIGSNPGQLLRYERRPGAASKLWQRGCDIVVGDRSLVIGPVGGDLGLILCDRLSFVRSSRVPYSGPAALRRFDLAGNSAWLRASAAATYAPPAVGLPPPLRPQLA